MRRGPAVALSEEIKMQVQLLCPARRPGMARTRPRQVLDSPDGCSTSYPRRNVVTRYGLHERLSSNFDAKAALLQQELSVCNKLSIAECRDALERMGEQTLGINDVEHLRKLLALRHLDAQTKVTRFPLRRTPANARASKTYMVVPVDVEGVGFVDFMLDTGSSGALITSELRDALGVSPTTGTVVRGLDASGLTLRQRVTLPPMRLGQQSLAIHEGFVTSLRGGHGDEVGGVLGLRFLSSFEVEIDPHAGAIAFHPIGHVQSGVLDVSELRCLGVSTLKGGLLSVPASLNGSDELPAILDLSATYTTINWPAAHAAFRRHDAALYTAQVTSSDGATNTVVRKGGVAVRLGSAAHGESYMPRDAPTMLVRDMPSLATLGYRDLPAMVVGRDLVGGRRTVLCLASGKVYVSEA